MTSRIIPYCGTAPVPGELWHRWNLDPVLWTALLACLGLYIFGARRSQLSSTDRALFVVGWLATSLALVSPLCPLSVALFAARVGQHMFLTTVAAPLVILGRPVEAYSALFGKRTAKFTPKASPVSASVGFAVALWFWHTPGPYDETFRSTFVYWAMHITTYGAALWLWENLLHRSATAFAGTVAATLITGVQMSLLGAVITFANRPLYAPHLLTTGPWGLSPLQDQQLGGAIMWVPAGVIFVGALVLGFSALMRRAESPTVAAQLTW